jgi:cytochrome c biogenesis protein CcmG, thiol:disulfide interchange protein DsbE
MAKQWTLVLGVLVGLVLGGAALVRYGPGAEAISVGVRAPDYTAVDLATGDSVTIRKRYRGHVTLVNIWATWCVPCQVEMPAMQRLYDSLEPRGFRIAAVSIDREGPEVVKQFASELKLTFDLLQDQSGEIQQAYQTTGVPESFLLDTTGVIMKRVIGAHDWAAPVDRALIRRLLGDTTAAAGPVPHDAAADSVPAPGR